MRAFLGTSTAPTRTLALDDEYRPLLGAALSALVSSAVAYDAVEQYDPPMRFGRPKLLSLLPRAVGS